MAIIDGKFYGKETIDTGAYVWANCIKLFIDKEHKYPIRSTLNDIWKLLTFEIPDKNGTVEVLGIPDCIADLEKDETFSWLVYGEFRSPNIEELTISGITLRGLCTEFLTCEVKPKKKILRNGDSFKLLFTFRNNAAWQKLPRDNGKVTFYGGFHAEGTTS